MNMGDKMSHLIIQEEPDKITDLEISKLDRELK